jgi:hypothetical protein
VLAQEEARELLDSLDASTRLNRIASSRTPRPRECRNKSTTIHGVVFDPSVLRLIEVSPDSAALSRPAWFAVHATSTPYGRDWSIGLRRGTLGAASEPSGSGWGGQKQLGK